MPDAATENLLRLVAAYSQSAITMSFKTGDMKAVEFKGQDGGSLIGVNTAARFIAGSSPLATQLLGETPEDKAKVGHAKLTL